MIAVTKMGPVEQMAALIYIYILYIYITELCECLTEEQMREALEEVSPMTRDMMHDVLTDLEDQL